MRYEIEDLDFNQLLREAHVQIEEELSLEDAGFIRLGSGGYDSLTGYSRVDNLKKSRSYATFEPLARRSVQLYTDFTLGSGMTFKAKDEGHQTILNAYWEDINNQGCLSVMGQRRSSDKLLIDGEIFFALFVKNKKVTVRRIDPLEIVEFICHPDDVERVLYYKRVATEATAKGSKVRYYRSFINEEGEEVKDSEEKVVNKMTAEKDVMVYHLPFSTILQRGNPLLLPVLDYLLLHRRVTASRAAIVLAMGQYAFKLKQAGGAEQIAKTKAMLHETQVKSGSTWIENAGADLQPISANTNAAGASEDARMLKLMIFAGVGLSEQYFGDIKAGGFATAKTVELPMMKTFEAMQKIWGDAYDVMDRFVLAQHGIIKDVVIDRDFPDIAPEANSELSKAIETICTVFPEFVASEQVQSKALLTMGINDVNEVISQLALNPESREARVIKYLRNYSNELEVSIAEMRKGGNRDEKEAQEEAAPGGLS